jgi:hypothetical protein
MSFPGRDNSIIRFGRLNGDKDGNFTCKGTSVVDYCISNVHFLNKFHCLKVLEFSSLLSKSVFQYTCTLIFITPQFAM